MKECGPEETTTSEKKGAKTYTPYRRFTCKMEKIVSSVILFGATEKNKQTSHK